jgi:hypothetical protein
MGKRESKKGIEISHWKIGNADNFQGMMQKEYDDVESVMPEHDNPDHRNIDAR